MNSFLYIHLLLKRFWFLPVRRGDVLAAWSGIRPLVTDPKSADTQSISRNHVVDISDSGLITIAGMWGRLILHWLLHFTLMNKCFVLFLAKRWLLLLLVNDQL
jgi:hypothetical protein